MIVKLDHTSIEVAKKIRSIFQVSYAVEAKLLQAIDFPPLKRNLDNFLNSKTNFFGIWEANELTGVIEVKTEAEATHIQSLVVHPKYFRQGLARKLMTFIVNNHNSNVLTVETGVDNIPAIALYEKFQFKEVKQWDTDHGVRKVRFKAKFTK